MTKQEIETVEMFCRGRGTNGGHSYQRVAEYDSRGHLKRNQLYCDECGSLRVRRKTRDEMTERGRQMVDAHERNLEIIKIASTLLSEDSPITLRRLHYLLVSNADAVLAGYTNTPKSYENLGRLMIEAREKYVWDEGYISPLCFVDESRTTISHSGWHSLHTFAETFSEGFDLDMWQNQPRIVEVIVEKDGLLSVLEPLCAEHQIYLRSCHGQTSISQACEIAKRFSASPEKIPTVLFGSDHDPSGYCIEDALRETIEFYALRKFETKLTLDWRRWGLLEDDFEKFAISSLEPKEGDKNLAAFREKFGEDAEFAEMDSLPAEEMVRRVTAEIENCKDAAIWQADLEQQSADSAKLRAALSTL